MPFSSTVMTDKLGLPSSLLLGVPIPEEYHEAGHALQVAVDQAVKESIENGMSKSGKGVTPWLLERVGQLTKGSAILSSTFVMTGIGLSPSETDFASITRRRQGPDSQQRTSRRRGCTRIRQASQRGVKRRWSRSKSCNGSLSSFCCRRGCPLARPSRLLCPLHHDQRASRPSFFPSPYQHHLLLPLYLPPLSSLLAPSPSTSP